MSKFIVITGITGNQGASVANAFLTDKNWRIRAVTRDPSKPSAQEWAAQGVVVRGDMDNVQSLTAAFVGAHAIFAMTCYWFHLSDPAVRAEAQNRGISPEKRCTEIEIQRGKNLALAAASPDVTKPLEGFIYSSLPNHSKLSAGSTHTPSTSIAKLSSSNTYATTRSLLRDPASSRSASMQTTGLARPLRYREILKLEAADILTSTMAANPFLWSGPKEMPVLSSKSSSRMCNLALAY